MKGKRCGTEDKICLLREADLHEGFLTKAIASLVRIMLLKPRAIFVMPNSNHSLFKRCFTLWLLFLVSSGLANGTNSLRFEIRMVSGLVDEAQTGRMIVVLSRNEKTEPRLIVTSTGQNAPCVLACDVDKLTPGVATVLDQHAIICPVNNLAELPGGDYSVQALLDSNNGSCVPNSPGNFYSDVQKFHLDPSQRGTIQLWLAHRIPDELLPPDTALVKFVKIQSRLLSQFHGRPVYLRAGIILPRDYDRESGRKYPILVRIGGYGTRYFIVNSLMAEQSSFRKVWLADDTPRMILLQLDGDGPYGDPFQINSANNGPFGDAVTQELIPYVESQFRAFGRPSARVLSGGSTGGWAALALQVYYPDFFNGVWSFCPDPVDFRAFELVNLYSDDNAYVNQYGFERPSERTVEGEVRLTLRSELQIENVLGRGDCWTMSGCDWCAWNALFGPRAADGHPAVPWNPTTGVIDHQVAEGWKNHDLRLVMQQNWKIIGPKLQGKLHIAVGDADNYYLNNAVHLLDNFLSHANPPFKGRITFGPGKGHGWQDVDLGKMLDEMEAVAAPAN